jgi:hypothetical protein
MTRKPHLAHQSCQCLAGEFNYREAWNSFLVFPKRNKSKKIRGRVTVTSALFTECSGFKTWLGNRLSRTKLYGSFRSLQEDVLTQYIKAGHNHFVQNDLQFAVH